MTSETIKEGVHVDKLLEYPFQYNSELPTLQEIASYRFCQAVFRANIPINDTPSSKIWRYEERVDLLIEDMNLPRPIEEILKQGTRKTSDELDSWTGFFGRIVRDIRIYEDSTFQINLDWCVWSPNGEIDYVKSATNALNSGELGETHTFFVLSKLCMKEQIENIFPTSPPWSAELVAFYRSPLVFYWVCYLKNKLYQIPVDEGSTLEKTMAVKCYNNDDRSALEYFWHRLENDDRISVAEIILSEDWPHRWPFLVRLFGTISSPGTVSLAAICVEYLKNSVLNSLSSQHQLRIWHRFKDQIADREFADMIECVFSWVMDCEDRMRMLIDIWDAADDHHRHYVGQYKANAMIRWFTGLNSLRDVHRSSTPESESEPEYGPEDQPCEAALNMLCLILSQIPENERSRLLKMHADGLVNVVESLESLQKTLNLCFSSADEESEFKYILSRSTKMQNICMSLLERGKRNDFNAKVEWMFSNGDPEAANEYKKLLLTLMTGKYSHFIRTFISSVREWNEISEFIDETYAEDVQSAFQMKRVLVKRAFSLDQYYGSFRRDFVVAGQIVEMVLPVQDLRQFKCVHLHRLGEQLQNGEYWQDEQNGDEIFVENFVEWCCDHDVESISKFKEEISCSAVLNAIVTKSIRDRLGPHLNLEALLPRLDRYLKWLVGSDERVRECKLQAIENSTIDGKMFKRASSVSERGEQLRIVLRWLCGGDEVAARRFMERRFGTFA